MVSQNGSSSGSVWCKPRWRQLRVDVLSDKMTAKILVQKPLEGERIALLLVIQNNQDSSKEPIAAECFDKRKLEFK